MGAQARLIPRHRVPADVLLVDTTGELKACRSRRCVCGQEPGRAWRAKHHGTCSAGQARHSGAEHGEFQPIMRDALKARAVPQSGEPEELNSASQTCCATLPRVNAFTKRAQPGAGQSRCYCRNRGPPHPRHPALASFKELIFCLVAFAPCPVAELFKLCRRNCVPMRLALRQDMQSMSKSAGR